VQREASAPPSLPLRAENFTPPDDLARLGRHGLVVGLVAAVACAIGFSLDREQFLRSYLIGYALWLSVAVGCLSLLMLHHMSRGAWGLVIRRILEAAARTLPYLALLLLPILFGMSSLYPWARPEAAHDEVLLHKGWYLNRGFFLVRMAIYFGVWSFLAYRLSALSRRQDESQDATLFHRMQRLAGPGIVIYALLTTFAGVDLLMSLDPHWYSSLYGLYMVICNALAALTFTVLVLTWLGRRAPMSHIIEPRHLHDYGKLMFAFVMVWAYFAFSQFLIIWSGNLPEETPFYLKRLSGGWRVVSLLVVLFHFVLPFLLLLSRDLKRSAKTLAPIAAWLFVMRWLDNFWQAAPAYSHGTEPATLHFHWLDLAAPVAIGGLWLWLFVGQLRQRSLLPVNDPYLREAIEHE
jgi:hypothetical protein